MRDIYNRQNNWGIASSEIKHNGFADGNAIKGPAPVTIKESWWEKGKAAALAAIAGSGTDAILGRENQTPIEKDNPYRLRGEFSFGQRDQDLASRHASLNTDQEALINNYMQAKGVTDRPTAITMIQKDPSTAPEWASYINAQTALTQEKQELGQSYSAWKDRKVYKPTGMIGEYKPTWARNSLPKGGEWFDGAGGGYSNSIYKDAIKDSKYASYLKSRIEKGNMNPKTLALAQKELDKIKNGKDDSSSTGWSIGIPF
jgi:hypothetical protein